MDWLKNWGVDYIIIVGSLIGGVFIWNIPFEQVALLVLAGYIAARIERYSPRPNKKEMKGVES